MLVICVYETVYVSLRDKKLATTSLDGEEKQYCLWVSWRDDALRLFTYFHRRNIHANQRWTWVGFIPGLNWVGLGRVRSIFFNHVLGWIGPNLQAHNDAWHCYLNGDTLHIMHAILNLCCAFYVITLKLSMELVVLLRRAGLQTQKL